MEESLYGIRVLDVEVSEESRGRGKDRPGASVETKMANDEKSFGGPGVDRWAPELPVQRYKRKSLRPKRFSVLIYE